MFCEGEKDKNEEKRIKKKKKRMEIRKKRVKKRENLFLEKKWRLIYGFYIFCYFLRNKFVIEEECDHLQNIVFYY